MVRRLGSSYSALKSPSSIARFSSTSLYVGTLTWIAQETWDDDAKREFFELHQTALPLVLLSPPPYVHARTKAAPAVLMRYLLVQSLKEPSAESPSKKVLAAVEIHGELGVFRVVRMMLSECRSSGGWEDHKAALAALISASCLMAEADLVILTPFHERASQQLMTLGLGRSHSVICPYSEASTQLEMLKVRRGKSSLPKKEEGLHADALDQAAIDRKTFTRLHLIDIDPVLWWQTSLGAESRLSLSFLEKRVARAKREETLRKQSQRRRVRPFERLARLFFGRT